jgi:O-antigen/teichoic acid export membrane protein
VKAAARFAWPGGWQRLYAPLKDDRVVSHNLIVGGGTMLAGVLGVAFQVLVSHQLQPAEFGGVFAVVTLITVIGLPANAFTLLMARETSRDRAHGHHASSATLLRRGNHVLLLSGVALGLILVLGSLPLADFLHVRVELILAAAAGLPFAMALPLLVGEFQGEQRFVALSSVLVAQAGLKLVAAIVLGTLFGAVGVIAGISLGGAVVYVVARRMLHRKLSLKARLPWLRSAASYLAVIMPSTLSLAVLLSADVLLVKHFFPTQVAGEYAAVAALGRAIFWGASGVAAVLFPKVVFRGSQGQSGLHLIAGSLMLVVLGGLFSLVLLSLASGWLLTAFAGQQYAGAAGYLSWYAVGMVLLGGAAILIATHQSHGKPGFLMLLVPLTLLEPALVVAFHSSVLQVVQVVDLSMASVFASLAVLYVVHERSRRLTSSTLSVAPQPAAIGTAG